MSTGSTKLDKKPFDLLAWGYWFIYILIIPVAIYIINKPGSEIKIPLSKHNIPPYYVLTSNDVYMRQVDISEAPSDAVRDIRSLIGHYTLTALVADKPFPLQILPYPQPLFSMQYWCSMLKQLKMKLLLFLLFLEII